MTNYKIILSNAAQTDLVITKDNKILLVGKANSKPISKTYLGPATKERVDLLIDNLQRLKVHCS